tara:strand:+ start:1126 stop:1824 length:699 start_codon:yes stop_codon:yes gene_type:complete
MPTAELNKAAPTLVPCHACGALNWGTEGKPPAICEGCGEQSRKGDSTRRTKPCPSCGRPKRLGQPCCQVRRPTARVQASRETLAAQATQERLVPLAILVVGGLLAVIIGAKELGLGGSLLVHALATGLYVAAGLGAAYLIGGSMFGWEMGPLGETTLKLAAVAAFDFGGSALLGALGVGGLGSFALWIAGWILMMRLFKLTLVQCFLFRVATAICAMAAIAGTAALLVGVLG